MYKNKIAYEREKKEISREKEVEHEEEDSFLGQMFLMFLLKF